MLTFGEIPGTEVFAQSDAKNAYHNLEIPINKTKEGRATLRSKNGYHEPTARSGLLFLSKAPATFMSVVDNLLYAYHAVYLSAHITTSVYYKIPDAFAV